MKPWQHWIHWFRNKYLETADILSDKQETSILIQCCKDPNDKFVVVNLPDTLWGKLVKEEFVRVWLNKVSEETILFTVDDLKNKQHC